jgi:hypothetical protein
LAFLMMDTYTNVVAAHDAADDTALLVQDPAVVPAHEAIGCFATLVKQRRELGCPDAAQEHVHAVGAATLDHFANGLVMVVDPVYNSTLGGEWRHNSDQ